MRMTLALFALALLISCEPQLRFRNCSGAAPTNLGFTNWSYTVQGSNFNLTTLANGEYTFFKEMKSGTAITGTFYFADTNNRIYIGTNSFSNITLGKFQQFYRYTWSSTNLSAVDTMAAD